ncbi:MAG: phosphotransferase, partial [Duncaniella sp.]|nr:phosphotransferase [Duncaniella sp.]
GVIGTNRAENEAFIYLSRHLASKNLPVPRVVAGSEDAMCYLQTDLGDTALFSCLDDTSLVEETLRALPAVQVRGAEGMDWSRCFPVPAFDAQAVMWDLNYFKYSYLNPLEIAYSEPLLEDAFRRLATATEEIGRGEGGGLMLRDFQSRNVMVKDGAPWFIDFQGARRGPLAYDVASFLWQAKAGFTPDERERLVGVYTDALARLRPLPADWARQLDVMVLLRTLQVLGAYGFRGLVQGKAHFIASIPQALANLKALLDSSEVLSDPALAELRRVLAVVVERPPLSIEKAIPGRLTVRVSSFSFKKGIPLDPSGNGGGFVFDCRAMDNPGRYDEYKPLTGLDAPVIEFLDSRGEIQRFLGECYA